MCSRTWLLPTEGDLRKFTLWHPEETARVMSFSRICQRHMHVVSVVRTFGSDRGLD